MKFRLLYILLFSLSFSIPFVNGQGFGLRFYGQEFELDKRTGLQILPDKEISLKENFALSFDISFLKNYNSYFGYVLRLVINDETNLDLIYENKFDTLNTINLIMGDKSPLVMMNVDKVYFYDWRQIKLVLDVTKKSITLQVGDAKYTLDNIQLNRKDKLKIFFGGNEYKSFQTSDLPNMTVKDITVFENSKLNYRWTLDQLSGDIAYDEISGKKAVVKNPFWLAQLHMNWTLEKSFCMKGQAQVIFNSNASSLWFMNSDSLLSYRVDKLSFSEPQVFANPLNLQDGMQLCYNSQTDRLFGYSVDLNVITEYNKLTRAWTPTLPPVYAGTQYLHHNKFFDSKTNSLYFFGGYGQLTYKNDAFKVNLNNMVWDTLSTDKVFTPRYLFGLGKNSNSDTIYIIGGFGSETGDQKQRPQYWYDLIRFIPATGKFEKVYAFDSNLPEDFCFANSIIIDKSRKWYYGLLFSKHHYNNKLRLVKGSLTRPEYEVLADSIPYTFHDVNSYSDLFYSESEKKLYAVTLFFNNRKETEIKIYSLLFPPAVLGQDNSEIHPGRFFTSLPFILIVVVTLACIFGFVYYRKKKLASKSESKVVKQVALSDRPTIKSAEVDTDVVDLVWRPKIEAVKKTSKSILLFGGFQIYDAGSEDITSQFTPLLKELFLLIFLNSYGGKKGISSNKMNEILWFDKSEKDARNNRAVNIARLKTLLQKIGNIEVSKQTGYWKIEFLSDDVYVDLFVYNYVVHSKQPSKEDILQLINITKNGSLLVNSDYEWLDEFKSETSNHIIDTLLGFADKNIESLEPSLLIHIADTVFFFDPLNEEAMVLKCKLLSKLGKHSLAKNTYQKFIKEYQTLYNEEYSKDFNEIVE